MWYHFKSLRSPERGLKYIHGRESKVKQVAPFAGAWIEIVVGVGGLYVITVAPFAGAWIEIATVEGFSKALWSLRSSERGLKYINNGKSCYTICRSVRRSVD